MQILFIHQNFPGQYRYLSRYFAAHPDWVCYGVGERDNVVRQRGLIHPQVKLLGYDKPPPVPEGLPGPAAEFTAQLQRATALTRVLLRQRQRGLDPDVIAAHPGWGEHFYLREVFPRAKLLFYFEFFFQPDGPLVGFESEFPVHFGLASHYRLKNAPHWVALDMADAGISPTRWQWSTFPREYRERIRVIHDGVDTVQVAPRRAAVVEFPEVRPGLRLTAEDEIVTYAVRNLEPSRGFHRFMRALPRLQRERPKAIFVVVGGDEVSYVRGHPSGRPWREVLLDEVGDRLDLERVLFVGRVPYGKLLDLFSITSLHLYLTYPFVLSWSVLEAMACEAPVLASATPPVEEVIRDGENGFLFDYFSEDALVARAVELLEAPELCREVGRRARRFVTEQYDLRSRCLPAQVALIESLLGR